MKLLKLIVLTLALNPGLLAQTNVNEEQGLKPYDSWHGGDLDSVSMTNGGLVLHIPLVSFPQRGTLSLSFSVLANTKNWQAVTVCTIDFQDPSGWNCNNNKWVPLPRGGLLPVVPGFGIKNTPNYLVDGAFAASSADFWFQSFSQTEPSDPDAPGQTTYDWAQSIVSPDGNVHSLASSSGSIFSGPTYPLRSLDASGLLFDGTSLTLPNGTHVSFVNGWTHK